MRMSISILKEESGIFKDQIIIDREQEDVRFTDGEHVVKIQLEKGKLKDILVNDVFIFHTI